MNKISFIVYFVFITLFVSNFTFTKNAYGQSSEINWEEYFKEENIPEHLEKEVKDFVSNYLDKNIELAIQAGEKLLPKAIAYYGESSEEIFEMFFYMGNLYSVKNNWEKSIDLFQRANILAENQFHKTHEYEFIEIKYALALDLLKIGRQNDGMLYLEETIDIIEKKNNDFILNNFGASKNLILFQILDLKLNLLTNSHNIIETKNTLDQLKLIITKDNSIPDEYVSKYYNHLGIYYGYLEQWSDMLPVLEEGRALLDKNSEEYEYYNNSFLHNIGMALTMLGQYDEAVIIYNEVERYLENNGSFSPYMGLQVYSNMGRLYSDMEYFDKSIIYYQKAISLIEKEEILNESQLAQTLINFSDVYLKIGKLDEAEKIINRAQIISDKKNEFLQNQLKQIFARLYYLQMDFDKAEKYLEKVILSITEKFGDLSPQLIQPNQALSLVYYSNGKSLEAIKLSKKNIILMKSQENNFSQLLLAHQLYSYSQALALHELEFPDDEYFLGNKPFQESIEVAQEALFIYKNFFDDHDFSVIFAKSHLGWVQHKSGNYVDGLQNVYESVEGIRKRLLNKVELKTAYGSKLNEQKYLKETLNQYLGILLDHILAEDIFSYTQEEIDYFIEEAFQTAQLLSATKANEALKKMGARAAASTPELQNLLFQKDQNVVKINKLNDVLVNIHGVLKKEKNIDEINNIKEQITNLTNKNQSIYRVIENSFPEYNDISGNKIIKSYELQNLLNDDEVAYFFHQDYTASVIFIIDKENLVVERLVLTDEILQKKINKLRDSLDLNKVNNFFDLKDFPEDESFDLYNKIFASGLKETILNDKKHIIIIPSGYFNAIPYWALLTSDTYSKKKKGSMFSFYSTLPWMPLKYSISVVPSVYSFTILRSQKEKNNSINSFVGIGNPIFNDDKSIDVSSIAFNDIFTKGGIADIKKINQFASLPETEKELRLIAGNFLPQNIKLYLKKEASEKIIKTENLSKADVIAFSTHATVSGELGLTEPGLILTPPETGSEENDGILTASEIAELKLNANLVLLSACNTAESGKYDSEPLSGLVRAFFFAGAKSLLVSHWSVESESAYMITTKMFERIAAGDTKSEALRKSIVSLINNPDKDLFSHPAFWAPFMLVGDGL